MAYQTNITGVMAEFEKGHIMKKFLMLLIVATSLLVAGCGTTDHATKWEYRTTNNLAEVNKSADQGWTVVNFAIPGGGPYEYLLKRAKP